MKLMDHLAWNDVTDENLNFYKAIGIDCLLIGLPPEMGANVPETIRYMGSRNKIVFVHFRNIRGSSYKFQEVFIDEGDVNMIQAMQTYRDAGFMGPFMMDHTPGVPHPSAEWAGRAYANGYIRALLQMVYR